jgi:hypothetical protein
VEKPARTTFFHEHRAEEKSSKKAVSKILPTGKNGVYPFIICSVNSFPSAIFLCHMEINSLKKAIFEKR